MHPEHTPTDSNTPTSRLAAHDAPDTSSASKSTAGTTPTAAPASVDLDSRCPECNTDDAITTVDDETVCGACGAIFSPAASLHHGKESRAHTQEEHNNRSRVGPARDPSDPNYGHQTFIGGRTEHRRMNISGRREQAVARMKKLRKWDSGRDSRNTKYGLDEINRMLTSLGYHEATAQQAATLFRKGQDEQFSHGRSIEAHAAAVVYATLRIQRHPVTLADITSVARIDRATIANTYDALKDARDIPIPLQHPTDYVARIASEVDAPKRLERAVKDLLEAIYDEPIAQGKHPAGLAAASLNALVALTPPGHYYENAESPSGAALARSVKVDGTTVRQNTDRLEEYICGEPNRSKDIETTIDAPIICPRATS